MTDARHPDRWLTDRRILRLSAAAYQLYSFALMWSVANRTDGVVSDDDLPLLPRVDLDRIHELEKVGLWTRQGDCWLIIDFAATQTPRAQLEGIEHRRKTDRERAARYREKKAGKSDDVDRDQEADIQDRSRVTSRDESRDDKGKARLGQDRQGQEDLGVTEHEAEPVTCSSCPKPLEEVRRVAGWSDCGTSGSAWPPVRGVPA